MFGMFHLPRWHIVFDSGGGSAEIFYLVITPPGWKCSRSTTTEVKSNVLLLAGAAKKKTILYPPIKGPTKKQKNHLNITALPCRQTAVSNEELEPLSYFLRSHLIFLLKFYLTERGNCWSTNASIGFVCYRVT